MTQFENAFSGFLSLFPTREKKTEKSPDYSGGIEFPLEEAMKLADWITTQPGEENYKGDLVIKVPICGWNRESAKNPDFKFISGFCSAPKKEASSEADVKAIF